jgi:hypothetical protein
MCYIKNFQHAPAPAPPPAPAPAPPPSYLLLFVVHILYLFSYGTQLFSFFSSNNILDAVKQFSITVSNSEDMRGLPESLLQLTATAAADQNETRYSVIMTNL